MVQRAMCGEGGFHDMSDHYVMHIQSSLTLARAERMINGALAAARAADLLPLTVAVLDSGGHLVAFKREDGCGVLRFDISVAWCIVESK